MATLAAIRTRVRTELGESVAAIWSDAELDEAINQAVEDYNLYWSYQATTTVVVSAGDRTITEPAGTQAIIRVTLDDGTVVEQRGRAEGSRAERERQAWERFAGVIEFTRGLVAGDVVIWYTRDHLVTEVPDGDVALLVAGGVWRALEMRSIDDLRRQGVSVLQQHRQTVDAARRRFERLFDGRRRRVRVG